MVTSSGLAAAGPAAVTEPTPNGTLEPYIHCDGFAGGIRAVTLDRRPRARNPWREVGFSANTRQVSVIDGYRLTYSYPRNYAFASLRAERSDASRYRQDRDIVSAHFAEMASADPALELAELSYRGFPVQLLTKKELGGRTVASAQILADRDAVIITISFLNQLPEHRSFQTLEEFTSLRDAFIRGYIDCVARKQ